MRTEYSPEYPLGFNQSKVHPEINYYFSWQEVAEMTRTNILTAPDGKRYELPTAKEDKPLITYKGNYGQRRSKDTLTERSPYVGIDIDIDEATCGFNKKNPSDEQRQKASDDLKLILTFFSEGDPITTCFFSKKSSSGCGMHIIINLADVPDGMFELYEKHILLMAKGSLNSPELQEKLNYRYNVDMAMLSLSQALHINHDPDVIFNPSLSTSAKRYTLKTEYGEGMVSESEKVSPIRETNEFDQRMFRRFEKFVATNKIRMEYTDIMRLAIIFFQLWPEGTVENFYEICTGFNERRAKERGNTKTFLKGLYYNVKKNVSKEVNGKRITVASLYYIMNEHGYQYTPEEELHFTGYLSSVENKLFEAFEKNDNILLEAPTGSGKTVTMFNHLKRLAVLFPKRKFVVCVPFTGMADQFAAENSDEQFKIKVFHGLTKNVFPAYTQLPDFGEDSGKTLKKDEIIHEVFKSDSDGFIQNSDDVLIKTKRKPRKIYQDFFKKPKKKVQKNKKNVMTSMTPLIPFEPIPPTYSNIWVTTYDSAPQLRNIHTLIIDECHNTVKQIEFRQEALKELDCVECKKKIRITATPDALMMEVEEFYHIRCVKDDAVKPVLKITKIKGAVTEALKSSIRETKTSLSFYNNKHHCQQIQSDLKDAGIDVSLYNTDTKKEPHQIKLKEESLIAPHGLATSYLQEGFNVLNQEVERINICNNYDICDVRQAAARPRRCMPEIHLLLKETEYEPGAAFRFNRPYEFIKEYARLKVIADKLNEISTNVVGDKNVILFKAFEDDLKFIYKAPNQSSTYGPHYIFPYEVDIAKLKFKINERYMHWLFHKQRELWLLNLSKYFTVVETVIVENNLKDPKKKEKDFDVFMNAGAELIRKFEYFERYSKTNKKLEYDEDMLAFSKKNERPQFKPNWKLWTERYFKMLTYDAVDFDIIKSGNKFSRWQKQADFAVSVNEGGKLSKEIFVAEINKAAVDFLLNVDLKAEKYTPELLFNQMNVYLRSLKVKKFRSQKVFYNSLKLVLAIKLKRVSGTGTRYITEITDIRNTVPYMTPERRRAIEDAGKDYSYLNGL